MDPNNQTVASGAPVDDTVVIPSQDSPGNVPLPTASSPQQSPPGQSRFVVDNPWPRRGLILAIVVGIIALLVGALRLVGSKKPSTQSPSQNVTITYWGLWENDATFRQFIADFETSHPGISVQYIQQSPKQYRERLQSAINRGEGPDVFRFHNTWIPMLRLQLATVPSSVMTTTDFTSAFYAVASNNLVSGSSIFGIPVMVDGLGLYINDDLFATAGVSAPVTWSDVSLVVPKLTVKNGTAIVTSAIALGTASNIEHFSDILGLLFFQNGADLTNLSGKDAEQALMFYRSFADPANPLYTWSDGMDNSVSAFSAGRVAMILAPSWRAHEITAANPKLKFHIAPVPQLQGNTVTWASYWVEGVSSKSQRQQAAWEFVKYLTSVEGSSKLYTEASKARLFGEPYARVELANTIQDDPYTGAFVRQASTARSFPIASRTFDNGLNDRMIQYLTDAVNSMATGASPTQVLQTVSAGFRQVLSSYGLSVVPQTTTAP